MSFKKLASCICKHIRSICNKKKAKATHNMYKNKVKSTLYMLKADHGDAFHLEVTDGENTTNIIIDSGPLGSYLPTVKPLLDKFEYVDLCIITHFDEDHSVGLATYLKEDPSRLKKFGELWLNSPDLIAANTSSEVCAYSQCNNLSTLIAKYEKENECTINCHMEVIAGITYTDPKRLVKIIVIAPTPESKKAFAQIYKEKYPADLYEQEEIGGKNTIRTLERTLEDWAKTELEKKEHVKQTVNDCSISCLIETADKSYLMLGDIREDVVIPWLEKYKADNGHNLKVDYMKVPHHGSKKNISDKLLGLIDCNNFIISTNGRYCLPDRYTIAKILFNRKPEDREEIKIFFNYERKSMEDNYHAYYLTDDEVKSGKYNFTPLIAGKCE